MNYALCIELELECQSYADDVLKLYERVAGDVVLVGDGNVFVVYQLRYETERQPLVDLEGDDEVPIDVHLVEKAAVLVVLEEGDVGVETCLFCDVEGGVGF